MFFELEQVFFKILFSGKKDNITDINRKAFNIVTHFLENYKENNQENLYLVVEELLGHLNTLEVPLNDSWNLQVIKLYKQLPSFFNRKLLIGYDRNLIIFCKNIIIKIKEIKNLKQNFIKIKSSINELVSYLSTEETILNINREDLAKSPQLYIYSLERELRSFFNSSVLHKSKESILSDL